VRSAERTWVIGGVGLAARPGCPRGDDEEKSPDAGPWIWGTGFIERRPPSASGKRRPLLSWGRADGQGSKVVVGPRIEASARGRLGAGGNLLASAAVPQPFAAPESGTPLRSATSQCRFPSSTLRAHAPALSEALPAGPGAEACPRRKETGTPRTSGKSIATTQLPWPIGRAGGIDGPDLRRYRRAGGWAGGFVGATSFAAPIDGARGRPFFRLRRRIVVAGRKLVAQCAQKAIRAGAVADLYDKFSRLRGTRLAVYLDGS